MKTSSHRIAESLDEIGRASPFLALVLLAVCSTPGASAWERVPGALDPTLSAVQMLELPEEIRAGIAFEAIVRTVGSSSCTVPDGAEVEVEGSRAEIRPMDRIAPDGTICTMDLASFPRTVSLTFRTPGNAEIVLFGRSMQGDTASYSFPVEVRG